MTGTFRARIALVAPVESEGLTAVVLPCGRWCPRLAAKIDAVDTHPSPDRLEALLADMDEVGGRLLNASHSDYRRCLESREQKKIIEKLSYY
jgi:hypothetical protein